MAENKHPPAAIVLGKHATNNTFHQVRIISDGPGLDIEGSGNVFLDYQQMPPTVHVALSQLAAADRASLRLALTSANSDASRKAALTAKPDVWRAIQDSLGVGGNLASITSLILAFLKG